MDERIEHARRGRLALACTALAVWGMSSVGAQQMTEAQKSAIRSSCRSDYMQHCSSVPPGTEQSLACLENNAGQLSAACQRALNTRIALALAPLATKKETLGTIEVAFRTISDLSTRTVTLSSPALQQGRFPGADPQQAQRFEEAIKSALDAMGERRVPLDMIVLSRFRDADCRRPRCPLPS